MNLKLKKNTINNRSCMISVLEDINEVVDDNLLESDLDIDQDKFGSIKKNM